MIQERKTLYVFQIFLCLLCLIIISSIQAQEEKSSTQAQEEKSPSYSIFKYSWELPVYGAEHEFAKKYVWSEPSGVGEGYILLDKTRNRGHGDEESISGFGAIRPLALDFGSFSLAFGVSCVAGVEAYEESDYTEYDSVVVGGVPSQVTVSVENVEGYFIQNSVSFSILGSFPKLGLQFFFDVGYAWSKLKVEFDASGRVDDLFGIKDFTLVDTYRDYQYIQRDVGMYLSFEIRKFFNRNYLNYFSILVYSLFKLDTDYRSSRADVKATLYFKGNPVLEDDLGRVELPDTLFKGDIFEHEAYDPQEGKDFDTNFVGASLTARIISFPMDIPSLVEGQAISLDFLGGLEHSAGELFGSDFHGVGVTAGGEISFFDVIALGFTYTWQMNNDQENEWDVLLMIGLYGGSSSSATPKVGRIPGN